MINIKLVSLSMRIKFNNYCKEKDIQPNQGLIVQAIQPLGNFRLLMANKP